MKNKKYNPRKLSQQGLTPLMQMQMKELANKRTKEAEEKILGYMMIIPLMVLSEKYWSKSPNSKFQKFFDEMMQLYNDFGSGDFELEDMKKYIKDVRGIDIDKLVK